MHLFPTLYVLTNSTASKTNAYMKWNVKQQRWNALGTNIHPSRYSRHLIPHNSDSATPTMHRQYWPKTMRTTVLCRNDQQVDISLERRPQTQKQLSADTTTCLPKKNTHSIYTIVAVQAVYIHEQVAENTHSSNCQFYDIQHHHSTGTFPVVDEY